MRPFQNEDVIVTANKGVDFLASLGLRDHATIIGVRARLVLETTSYSGNTDSDRKAFKHLVQICDIYLSPESDGPTHTD